MRDEPRDPRSVDEHVAAAELALDLLGEPRERGTVGHVGREREMRSTRELGREHVRLLARARVADDDAKAGVGERPADSRADAAGTARHDGHLLAQDAPP